MAGRPIKQELDFFPHPTNNNDIVNALVQEFGANGYAVYYSLCEKIFNNGYFYEINNSQIKLLCLKLKITEDEFYNILSLAIDLDLFDKEIYSNYNILTNEKLQNDFFYATKRRKQVILYDEFCLVDINTLQEEKDKEREIKRISINDNNNSINVDRCLHDVNNNSHTIQYNTNTNTIQENININTRKEKNKINDNNNSINVDRCLHDVNNNSHTIQYNTNTNTIQENININTRKEKNKIERDREIEKEKEKESAEGKNHRENKVTSDCNNVTLENSTTEKNLQDEEFRAIFSSFSNSKTVNI